MCAAVQIKMGKLPKLLAATCGDSQSSFDGSPT
jgi:hypothetical protein